MEENKIYQKINFLNCTGNYDELLKRIENESKDELKIQIAEKRITVSCHDGRNVLRLKSNLVDVLVIEHLELDKKMSCRMRLK